MVLASAKELNFVIYTGYTLPACLPLTGISLVQALHAARPHTVPQIDAMSLQQHLGRASQEAIHRKIATTTRLHFIIFRF